MMPKPPFTWDPTTGQYRRRNGRFVPRTEIRAVLDLAIDTASLRVRGLGVALREGKITRAAWDLEMRATIKAMHIYSTAAAKGGWAQLTQADLGRIGAKVKEQYKYLSGFSAQLRNGLPLDGRFLSRVELYAEASRAIYMSTEEREMKRRGYSVVQNVLHKADHCDDCKRETARGWVAIGTLVPIGARACKNRCRCTFIYQ